MDTLGEELEDRIGHTLAHLLGLGAEDGNAGLYVGGLDIHDEAAGEPGLYAVFEQGERGHGPVGCEHYLAVGHVEGVERVKEALLGLFLADKELDVVQEEQVGAAVAFPELVGRALAYGLDIGVGELLGGGVDEGHAT